MQEKKVSLYDLGNEIEGLGSRIVLYNDQLDSWFVLRREKKAIREKLPALHKRFDEKLKEYEELKAALQIKEQREQRVQEASLSVSDANMDANMIRREIGNTPWYNFAKRRELKASLVKAEAVHLQRVRDLHNARNSICSES